MEKLNEALSDLNQSDTYLSDEQSLNFIWVDLDRGNFRMLLDCKMKYKCNHLIKRSFVWKYWSSMWSYREIHWIIWPIPIACFCEQRISEAFKNISKWVLKWLQLKCIIIHCFIYISKNKLHKIACHKSIGKEPKTSL
jgi:hypothetical protein